MEDERLEILAEEIFVLAKVADKRTIASALAGSKAVNEFLQDPR
jgi:hypothetical protein